MRVVTEGRGAQTRLVVAVHIDQGARRVCAPAVDQVRSRCDLRRGRPAGPGPTGWRRARRCGRPRRRPARRSVRPYAPPPPARRGPGPAARAGDAGSDRAPPAGSRSTGPWPGRISRTPRSATTAREPVERGEVGGQVAVGMHDHRRAPAEDHVSGQQPGGPVRARCAAARSSHWCVRAWPAPRSTTASRAPSTSGRSPIRSDGSAAHTSQPTRRASSGAASQ